MSSGEGDESFLLKGQEGGRDWLRVPKKGRKLESHISFLRPQDASMEKVCGQPGHTPLCDQS